MSRRQLQEMNLTDTVINGTIATTRSLTVEKIDRIILRTPIKARDLVIQLSLE